MVVLEREDRARARGATIYASIDGYASTCDAYHRVQMAPDGEEIVRAMSLAIERSGRPLEEIGYVNYHGTSTVLNDAVESRCVRAGVRAPRRSTAGFVGEVDDRASAGRERRRRHRDRGAGDRARVPAADHQPVTIPIPAAISTTCRITGGRAEVEAALCNCLGFGSKNSAIVIGRVESSDRLHPIIDRCLTAMTFAMHRMPGDVLIVGAGRRARWRRPCWRAPARACAWSIARRFRATSCAATR